DVHDVLVTDARDRSRLLKEARDGVAFGGEFGAQDFQRHPAAELDVLAEIDLPHAALAQNREHAVAAQGAAQQRLFAIVDDDTWGRVRDRPRQPLRPRAPAALVPRLNGPRDRWRRWRQLLAVDRTDTLVVRIRRVTLRARPHNREL